MRVHTEDDDTTKKYLYDGMTSKKSYLIISYEFKMLQNVYHMMDTNENIKNIIGSFRDIMKRNTKAEFNNMVRTTRPTNLTLAKDINRLVAIP